MKKWLLASIVFGFSLFGLLINQAHAATAFVQVASGTNGGGVATLDIAFGNNVAAGNVLVFGSTWFTGTATLNSVTSTCTTGNFQLLNLATSSGQATVEMGYASVTNAGTCTVHFTYSGTVEAGAILEEVSGANLSNIIDANTIQQIRASTSTDAVTSGNATTTIAGDFIFGYAADIDGTGGTTYTAGTGFTGRASFIGFPSQSEDKIQSVAGSTAATFTTNSVQNSTAGVIAIRPTPPPSPSFRLIGRGTSARPFIKIKGGGSIRFR